MHFYNEALRTRNRLDARDLELLSAEEPLEVSTPPNLVEGERRYRALLAKRPGDAEVLLRLGWIAYWRHDTAAIVENHDALAALAPTMAATENAIGFFARESSNLELAQRHYQICVAMWPGAASCLTGLGRTAGERGQCTEYFSLMRRAVVLTPDDWLVRLRFLEALLSAGRDENEARAEVQVQSELFESLSKHLIVHADLERALWFGSFEDAEEALDHSQAIMRGATGWSGLTFVTARLAVAEERNDEQGAVAILKRYVGHRAARPPAFADALVLPALVRHHVMPLTDVMKLRDTWRTDAEASADWKPWQTALDFESVLAATPSEAKAALARMDLDALPAVIGPAEALILGRLLLLAGRPADARSRLESAAGSCSFMDSGGAETQSTSLVHASWELGRALEVLHDTAGACSAYRHVLDRWGHATPRSVTAENARAARTRLRCENVDAGPSR